jgi:hypothetical protein
VVASAAVILADPPPVETQAHLIVTRLTSHASPTFHHAGDGGTSYSSHHHHAEDSATPYIAYNSTTPIVSQPLTAEELAERERKAKERQEEKERQSLERREKRQQRRQVRAEVATSIKAKRHEATKLREKVRLTATLLTLKLHR